MLEVDRRRRVLKRWPIKLGCERRRGREEDEEREIEFRAVENRDLDAHRQAISCCELPGFCCQTLSYMFLSMLFRSLTCGQSRASFSVWPITVTLM